MNCNYIYESALVKIESHFLLRKENAAGIIACFCMAVLDGISDRELPDSLKTKIVILANAALDGEVEEVKIYETQKG